MNHVCWWSRGLGAHTPSPDNPVQIHVSVTKHPLCLSFLVYKMGSFPREGVGQ